MLLFCTRRFLPLFLTQFLGALNDNLFKNALVMLVTYRIAAITGQNAQFLVTLAAGLFILPFFLFSAIAGQVADKFDRAALTRIIKTVEIVIMAIAVIGFMLQNSWLLFLVLFGMGTHSTFFGPIKYALLPQQLAQRELLAGNAYIEAGTFLAILSGTILGSVLILQPHGRMIVSAVLLLVAIAGYLSSRKIPTAPATAPALRLAWNIWRETGRIISYSYQDRQVFLCVLGISWFWLIGATLLAEFAPFVKTTLHATPAVVTLLLTIFSVGIGIGSVVCNRLLRGRVRARYVSLACLGISLFGIDLYFTSRHFHMAETAFFSLWSFVTLLAGLHIVFDLLMIAIFGGLYIVPLYATMQHRAPAEHMARVIAANNVMNALFMVIAVLLILGLLAFSLTIPEIFLCVFLANLGVTFYIRRLRV